MNIESLETSSQLTSEHVANAYRAKLAELTDSIVSSSAKEAKQTLEEFQLKHGILSINVLHDAIRGAISEYERARSKASAHSRDVLKEQSRILSEQKFLKQAEEAFRNVKFQVFYRLPKNVSGVFAGDVLCFVESERANEIEPLVRGASTTRVLDQLKYKNFDCHFVYCFCQDHFLTEDGDHLDCEDLELLLEGYSGFILDVDI